MANMTVGLDPPMMTDKTVGFGWDSTYDDRQDSMIWMGLNL